MASLMCNWLGNQIFSSIMSVAYVALHAGDPGPSGSNPTEFVGGSYVRKRTTWSAASNKTATNANQLIWANLPVGQLIYLGLWTSVNEGQLMVRIPVTPTIPIGDGQQFVIQVADLAITF